MRILTLTGLYPSSQNPRLGIFVEQRLRHLIENKKIESKVVAPVPWFPFKNSLFKQYSRFAKTPKVEERYGINIMHPRYLHLPKIGMYFSPYALAYALKPHIDKLISSGYDFDLIDAHYFYPDGVAASLLSKWFNKPLVITARGTDINLIPEYHIPRKLIIKAATQCEAIITVCKALKESITLLGIDPDKIHVLRNGVDFNIFSPVDRSEARKRLSIEGRTLLSVGYLIERKGHHIIIEALEKMPDVNLIIIGDGEQESYLKSLVFQKGLSDRVRFEGSVSHELLKYYYSAVDALVLASSREGMANVLLESIACGNPVIATSIWGTPEVINSKVAGVLMKERNANSLVEAYLKLFKDYPDRSDTHNYAKQFGWDATTDGIQELFLKILQNSR